MNMKKRVTRTQFVQTASSFKKTSMPERKRAISCKVKNLALLLCILALPLMLCSCLGKEAESIILSESSITLTVGDSKEISAKITPEDARDKTFDWSSSDSSVISVEDGVIKAKKAGEAEAIAKTDNGIKKSCKVVVIDKEITEVTLDYSDVSVKSGKKIQLTAKTQPSDAPQGNLVWSSSDESIATVNENGFVTGKKNGTAVINCTSENGKSGSCTVTVKGEIKSTDSTDSTNNTSPTDSTQPTTSSGTSTYGFIFSDSSTRKLTQSEVAKLSDTDIQYAINEIYARNGYIFKDEQLKTYYSSMPWYTPNPSFSTSDLNDIESYNINLLTKYR